MANDGAINQLESQAIESLNWISSIPKNPDIADIMRRREALSECESKFSDLLLDPQHKELRDVYKKTRAILETQLSQFSKCGVDKATAYKQKHRIMRELEIFEKIRQQIASLWSNDPTIDQIRKYASQNGISSVIIVASRELGSDRLRVSFVMTPPNNEILGTFMVDKNGVATPFNEAAITIPPMEKLLCMREREQQIRTELFKLNIDIHGYNPNVPEVPKSVVSTSSANAMLEGSSDNNTQI